MISYYVPELPPKPTRSAETTKPVAYLYNPSSCVSYAKYRRPDQAFVWIAPKYVESYKIEPAPGLLVITSEGPVGHVAYVESVSETTLFVSEANYKPGLVTRREIPRDSPYIVGYR